MRSTLSSTSSLIVCVMLVLARLDLTSELQALSCNTRSSPEIIDLELRRLCHKQSDNVVSCEVSYLNHTTTSHSAVLTSCYKYSCGTYWGFFGAYSADRMVYRYVGNLSSCLNESVPEDPYICNWYYCCSKVETQTCRCVITNVTVAISTVPPYMYCSFTDCSSVKPRHLSSGKVMLSDGSLLTFSPFDLSPGKVNTTLNGTISCNSSSKIVSFDEFRRAYPLKNWSYISSTLNVTCSNISSACPKSRKRRDLSQITYAIHKLKPVLADAWEDCEVLQAIIRGVFSTGVTGSSQFLRYWLTNPDIIGYMINGVALVWQCTRVNVTWSAWNESTYYPPVLYKGQINYLTDEDRIQDSTPEARPGLKRFLYHSGAYYLGTVASNMSPQKVSYNRSSHDYHLEEFNTLFNLTPENDLLQGHETNPINHAFGTQSGLLPYTRSTNITSTDTGPGWVHIGLPSFAFLNPLGWLKDLFSWAAWIGGILYLITLCISLPALITRRRRLGRWST
ncbi:TPA_asm: glycoprotein [Caribbean watersnake bornavirus]|uniref:Glycoprotein n=1 Tax=Caribbean watersnake bornavirus TaxID=2817570 RepID=A0A8D9UJD3_9MONO|nr:TPA_asm: glycoprotein [Caribbean watersnake bornavirus]